MDESAAFGVELAAWIGCGLLVASVVWGTGKWLRIAKRRHLRRLQTVAAILEQPETLAPESSVIGRRHDLLIT